MLFNSILIASAFAALASARQTKQDSRLEAFLKAHPNPVNVTLGHGHGIDPGVHVKRGMGNAIIGNRCDHDIWVWSADGNVRSHDRS
jgi:hypothetical protein